MFVLVIIVRLSLLEIDDCLGDGDDARPDGPRNGEGVGVRPTEAHGQAVTLATRLSHAGRKAGRQER